MQLIKPIKPLTDRHGVKMETATGLVNSHPSQEEKEMTHIKDIVNIDKKSDLKCLKVISKPRGGFRPTAGRKKKEDKTKTLTEKIEIIGNEEIVIKLKEGESFRATRTEAILFKLCELALDGNTKAAKEFLDRILGKSKESLDLNAKISIEEIMLKILEDRRDR